MPLKVTIKWTGIPEFRAAIAKLRRPELDKPISRALVACGMMVLANAAEEQILRGGRFRGPAGPRGGRGALRDSPPNPDKLTSRSGELRRSLSVNRGLDRSGLSSFYVEVGSDLVYAPLHELGLGRFPVRAFLSPAMDAVSGDFEGVFMRELEAELPA